MEYSERMSVYLIERKLDWAERVCRNFSCFGLELIVIIRENDARVRHGETREACGHPVEVGDLENPEICVCMMNYGIPA